MPPKIEQGIEVERKKQSSVAIQTPFSTLPALFKSGLVNNSSSKVFLYQNQGKKRSRACECSEGAGSKESCDSCYQIVARVEANKQTLYNIAPVQDKKEKKDLNMAADLATSKWVTKESLAKAKQLNVVFTSINNGQDLIAIPLKQIPGEDNPDWQTMRVEIEMPVLREAPETESEQEVEIDESRRHFAASPDDTVTGSVPCYLYTLFSTEELKYIVVDDTKLDLHNNDMKMRLTVFGVDKDEYEYCDDVTSFFTDSYRCSSVEVNVYNLIKVSGEDLVGMLLFVDMDPRKIYLVRPEVPALESNGMRLDISCLVCFTFAKQRSLEIFDFFNDDEDEESYEEDEDQQSGSGEDDNQSQS